MAYCCDAGTMGPWLVELPVGARETRPWHTKSLERNAICPHPLSLSLVTSMASRRLISVALATAHPAVGGEVGRLRDCSDRGDGRLDVIARDIEVGNCPNHSPHLTHANPLPRQRHKERVIGESGATWIEEHHIRLRMGCPDCDALNLRQSIGKPSRILVVLDQAPDMVIKRMQAPCRSDPRLPHRTAEDMLIATRLGDEFLASGQHGANRRAQALGEVDPNAVDHRREFHWGTPLAAQAFSSRAPSMCTAKRSARAASETAVSSASDQIEPPPKLCVCSTQTSRAVGP